MQCILTFAWSGKKKLPALWAGIFFSAFFRAGIFFLQILPAPFPHKKGELVAVEPIFLRREMVITSYVQYIYINTMRFSLCRFKFGPPPPSLFSKFILNFHHGDIVQYKQNCFRKTRGGKNVGEIVHQFVNKPTENYVRTFARIRN